MKIAVLAHSFPRFPGDTHGPFVEDLSAALARRGHEVTVLVPWDPELRLEGRSPVAVRSFRYVWPPDWHRLGYSRTLRRDVGLKLVSYLQSPLYFLFAERALRRLVVSEGIDCVHAHWILPNGYVAARVARATGVPFAATLHGSDVFMAERNPLFGRLARAALAGASHVTSCSPDLRDRLARIGRPEDSGKVLLVPNGTDLVLAAAAAAGPRTAGPTIVAVGRLVDKKGFRYLVEAMPAVRARVPGARLLLGGGGPLELDLESRVRDLGLEDAVELLGPLSHPEVLELIGRGDVFAMPSIRDHRGNIDGLPIVVLEAMAAGRPVVATDVSGIPLAIEHDRHGLLVPEKDPAALATALAALLEDPERRRSLGEAARRRIDEELNWDAVAAIHDRLFAAAVAA